MDVLGRGFLAKLKQIYTTNLLGPSWSQLEVKVEKHWVEPEITKSQGRPIPFMYVSSSSISDPTWGQLGLVVQLKADFKRLGANLVQLMSADRQLKVNVDPYWRNLRSTWDQLARNLYRNFHGRPHNCFAIAALCGWGVPGVPRSIYSTKTKLSALGIHTWRS